MNNIVNKKAFLVSNIYDETSNDKTITYKFKVVKTDEYKLYSSQVVSIKVFNSKKKLIIEERNEMIISLKKNQIIYVSLTSKNKNESFVLDFYSINNNVTVTYDLNIKDNGKDIPLYSNNDCSFLKEASIKMSKRKGGTYIYNNVPESLPDEVVNTIIMQNHNLKNECFMTFENSNRTSIEKIYLGYRIVNNDDHDIYVTIKNVGYQVDGSWLGEKAWIDYYGLKCDMDKSNFTDKEFIYDNKNYNAYSWFNDYLNFDVNHKPHNIRPTTIKLPKGKYIYVIGGTSEDSYKNININDTANNALKKNHCANGNVLFIINNGVATGEFVCYDDVNKINSKDVIIQNMRKYGEHDDFGGRMGVSNHHGVIECNPVWVFNDKTKSTNLPVKYYPKYANELKESYKPFEKVKNIIKHEVISDRWLTHLSAMYHHNYVGDDMVSNKVTYNNKEIILSVNQANPAGKVWDFGNWMIEYQENLVFVNQGDKERTIKFYLINGGSIFYIFKDEEGNVLKCGTTFITCTGRIPCYEIIIQPHSRKVISMQSVLLANNNGSIEHIVELI